VRHNRDWAVFRPDGTRLDNFVYPTLWAAKYEAERYL
jgi:hypothetical protein